MGISLYDEYLREQSDAAQAFEQDMKKYPATGGVAPSVGTPDFSKVQTPGAKPPKANPLLQGIYQVGRGVTGGLLDRPVAGLAALLSGDTYANTRANLDRNNREFAEDRPVVNAALNIGGALVGPSPVLAAGRGAANVVRGTGTLAKLGRNALGAAVGGAAANVGYQDGDADRSLAQTAGNALSGAAAGAALGTAASAVTPLLRGAGGVVADVTGMRNLIPAAGSATRAPGTGTMGQRAFDAAEGILFPEQVGRRADRKVMSAVTKRGKQSLDDVAANTRFENILTNNEAMIADQGGDYGMRLARGVKTASDEGSDALRTAFTERNDRLLGNVRDDLRSTVAGPVNTVQASKGLRQQAKDASGALYAQAEPQSVVLSEGARGVLLDRDPRGIFRAAHQIGRDLAKEQGIEIPALFGRLDDGSRVLTRDNMTVQELDYIKKGIQELADRGAKSGKTISRSRARAMLKNLETLVQDADAQVPDYAAARQAFAGPTRQAEAMRVAQRGGKAFGKADPLPSFKSGSPDQLADVVAPMSAGEREFYDIGKGATMYRDAARDSRKFVRDLGSTTKSDAQDRLRATTQGRDAAKADELIAVAQQRAEQVRKGDQVLSGSQTADKVMDDVATSLPSKSGQLKYAPARAVLDLLLGQSLRGAQGRTAREVADRLTKRGGDAEDYLRYLQQFDEFDRLRSAGRGQFGRDILTTLIGAGSQ